MKGKGRKSLTLNRKKSVKAKNVEQSTLLTFIGYEGTTIRIAPIGGED